MMWMFFFLFHLLKTRLVRELEKKFSGKHVVIVARVCVYCNPWAVVLTIRSWYINCTFGHRVTLADVIIYLCFINVQQNYYSECQGQDIWQLFVQCIFSIHCWFIAEIICVQWADPIGREFWKHLYCKKCLS